MTVIVMRHEKYKHIYEAIQEAGGQPYIVGGYVRDLLLGRAPRDVDIVVVGMSPQAMDSLVYGLGGCPVDGTQFFVYVVDGCEIALARTERKTGQGYTGFECVVDRVPLEEDLLRRDLTINAIAMDPFTNKIIDPHGGVKDLEHGVLRPVSKYFKEDPLRVLRAARFAAQLQMEISDRLVELAKDILHEIPALPGERLFLELEKALRTPEPSRFFRALDLMEALEVTFPEIAALKGRVQPEQYHPEGDAYIHTLEVIDRAREANVDDETMFAALVHDLGKAVTPDDQLPHHYNHEALGVPIVHALCDRLRVPYEHRKTAAAAAKEHLNIHRFNDMRTVKQVRLLVRLNAIHNDVLLKRVVAAAEADARGRGREYALADYPQAADVLMAAHIIRKVKGSEFAHLKDGRVIAQKMEQARVKVLNDYKVPF